MEVIARIYTDFPTKFGIPRQSGLAENLTGKIIFEQEFRRPEAVRGLENYSHVWLIWLFSEAIKDGWSPTVRPPRLGGNTRMGVFATRSPFRPNSLGLSCVRLERVELSHDVGPVLYVAGADLMDGTPILDIKPYLPFTDSRPEAVGGFAEDVKDYALEVDFPGELLSLVPQDKRAALVEILSGDPRPSYQNDPCRVYGFPFAGMEIKFIVAGCTLTVKDVIPDGGR